MHGADAPTPKIAEPTTLDCLLVTPSSSELKLYTSDRVNEGIPFLRPILLASEETGVKPIPARKVDQPVKTPQTLQAEISKVDIVLVEASVADPTVFFYLGFAKALGKPIISLHRHDGTNAKQVIRLTDFPIEYEANTLGLEDLTQKLKSTFQAIRRADQLDREILLGKSDIRSLVDWHKVNRVQYGNLCYEMLIQKGFRDIEWLEGTDEIDLVSRRVRAKGREEIALMSIGGGLPDDMTIQLWGQDFTRVKPQIEALVANIQGRLGVKEVLVKLWFLWSPQDTHFEVDDELWKKLRSQIIRQFAGLSVKIGGGIWHKDYIDRMVGEHPMVVRKYFAEDRENDPNQQKTIEDIYRETAMLEQRAMKALDSIEKAYRVDPALEWQEKAYTVTHSIGNAIFPVETYLDFMRQFFEDEQHERGIRAAAKAKESIEKAKLHIRKFKTIAALKKAEVQAIDITPRIYASVESAKVHEIDVRFYGFENPLPKVWADLDMFDELMDELVTNSIHWLVDQAERQISITAKVASPDDLPQLLQQSDHRFLWLRFQDSGPGIRPDLKEKIFDLFFSRRQNGMGFGLAIVRKNIRDFGGEIIETGVVGTGVQFDTFLPMAVG